MNPGVMGLQVRGRLEGLPADLTTRRERPTGMFTGHVALELLTGFEGDATEFAAYVRGPFHVVLESPPTYPSLLDRVTRGSVEVARDRYEVHQ
jgi:hypothetical protein